MSQRYAVLWETAPEHAARPVGLVVEQDDHVMIEARDELGLPRLYKDPFEVLGPDMTVVRYTPSDQQYFDHVILDLSRGFVIGKEGRVNQASQGVILKLLSEHVFQTLRREHIALYWDKARTYPTVRSYQQACYGEPAGHHPSPELDSPAKAGASSYLAA